MLVKAFAANFYEILIFHFRVVNDLGNKLLSLWKSIGLKILNNRHYLGMEKIIHLLVQGNDLNYVILPDEFSNIDQFL